ncbi:hypothetical protein [Acinetobacter pollinis]|uniref:hypothetical protein n=1 Tax=Acinetobacter pollinis TaxID=2605270 RepID=UPI0018A2A306|nr:hypothetical protein [Acinetobacter pollinis]MBF7690882.1 hypothetical protein [Acinetobacter pollinis]MBF7697360.1 hypothetical protein [Acinetobacter pollinis]
MDNGKNSLKINTPDEALIYLKSLNDGIWDCVTNAVDIAIAFYASKSKFKFSIDDFVLFSISLLEDEPKYIFEFRDRFKKFILENDGNFRKLNEFPKGYNAKNKKLTKNEDGELSLYLALKHCVISKNATDDNYNLNRANFLLGHGTALLGIESVIINSLHNEVKAHDLGGKMKAQKSKDKQEKAYDLFKAGGYTSYASCARDIYEQLGLKDPMTVSKWLSKMDRENIKK